MISSATEFVELRDANEPRATHDELPEDVCLEVIEKHPEYKTWVIHNKTVPISILRLLSADPDPTVRCRVAMKRKCPQDILELLAMDEDYTVRNQANRNPKFVKK